MIVLCILVFMGEDIIPEYEDELDVYLKKNTGE